jgi:hypothetical protein
MKSKKGLSLWGALSLVILIVLLIGIIYLLFYYPKTTTNTNPTTNTTTIATTLKIASFNSQIFGDNKLQELGIPYYNELIKNYDIFFLQEIRDSDGSSFNELCQSMNDYKCYVSSRAGRSSSKEQYGVLYKKELNANFTDYNPDDKDRWERPPLEANFKGLTIYTIHTKPDDVPNEINHLEEIVEDTGRIIILGDLNADCDYYDNSKYDDFDDWNWVILDDEDTTTGNTHCAYDRIIINDEFVSYGINKNITKEVSDHYLVWIEIKIKE